MRHLTILSLLLAAAPLAAIETRPLRGDRVAVVSYGHDREVAVLVQKYVTAELRRAGFDAYRVRAADGSGQREKGARGADFVVEIDYEDSASENWGGVGVGGRHVGAEISVVSAHIAARVRIYHGASREIVDEFSLQRSATSPTISGIGVGDHSGYLYFALPFMHRLPYRAAARSIARDVTHRVNGASSVVSR